MTDRFPSFACLAVAALIGFATPASAQTTTVHLKNTTGADVGTVTATEVDDGVLMKVAVKGLPPGTHAFHVHAVGKCEPPFTSAGGHFNPDHKSHGMMAESLSVEAYQELIDRCDAEAGGRLRLHDAALAAPWPAHPAAAGSSSAF